MSTLPLPAHSHWRQAHVSKRLSALFLLPLTISLASGCADQATAGKAASKASLAAPFPDASPQNVVAVTSSIFPAVVRLDVAQEVYQQGRRTMSRGIGSGVIID